MRTTISYFWQQWQTTGTVSDADAAEVARARQGDMHAFEALVRRYQDTVLNLARRIVNDTDVAHDVMQEAFLTALQQLPRFRGTAKFSTWLYTITVNAARMHLRAERRRHARWEQQCRDNEPGIVSDAFTQIDEGPVMTLLRELPEKQRIALALFYLQELSVAEIAAIMHAPTGTVKAWLARGRTALRALAEARGALP